VYRDAPFDDRYRRALGAARAVAQLARMIDELDGEIVRQQVNAERMRELLVGERNEATVEVLEGSLHEATAATDELSRQREALAQRRDAIAPIADELAELRAERIASLAETPAGDEALALVTRLAELDDEQRAVAHAIAAGEAAQDPLIAIATVDAFATGQHMNQSSDYHDYADELAWLVRNLRKHAGPATARLVVFRRALADVGLQLTAELPSSEHRKVFFTSAGARPDYNAVWGQLMAVVQQVAARLTELYTRNANVDASIAALEAERDRLLQP
jgi:hypothetical protein